MNLYFAFKNKNGDWIKIRYGENDFNFCVDYDRFVSYVSWIINQGYSFKLYHFSKCEEDEIEWNSEYEKGNDLQEWALREKIVFSEAKYCGEEDNEGRVILWKRGKVR